MKNHLQPRWWICTAQFECRPRSRRSRAVPQSHSPCKIMKMLMVMTMMRMVMRMRMMLMVMMKLLIMVSTMMMMVMIITSPVDTRACWSCPSDCTGLERSSADGPAGEREDDSFFPCNFWCLNYTPLATLGSLCGDQLPFCSAPRYLLGSVLRYE